MAVMCLLFPAVLHYTHSEVHFGKSEMALSRFSSCIMLLAYAAYLFFQLRSQMNQYVPIEEVDFLLFLLFYFFPRLIGNNMQVDSDCSLSKA